MSTEIAVRLPDELVTELDGLIAEGREASRDSVIERAVVRELQRLAAASDAVLARTGTDADLDRLAEYAARVPLDLA
jgi:antitoxin MazE3